MRINVKKCMMIILMIHQQNHNQHQFRVHHHKQMFPQRCRQRWKNSLSGIKNKSKVTSIKVGQ